MDPEYPYGHPAIRQRMVEFLGGSSLRTATAVFVQGVHPSPGAASPPQRPSVLPDLHRERCEVARSLWDRRGLVVDLDIEYVNFDFPGEVYLEPERSFRLQRPVVAAAREILEGVGIDPLHLVTGRGHHFLWTVERGSPAFRRLARLGRVAPPLAAAYAARHRPWGTPVDPSVGAAFAGLGLVMEHVGHRIRDVAGPRSSISVELGELRMGPTRRGLEIVAIDLSEYGDALHTRRVTLPFSRYLKPRLRAGVVGEHVERDLPSMVVLPAHGEGEGAVLYRMRNEAGVLEAAREVSTRIPEHGEGMEELVSAYEGSELRRFHDRFYAEEHEPPRQWPTTYDRMDGDSLPPEAARALQWPNDLLLQPVGIFHVVRALTQRGWHPRHIAGLVRSKYERDHGWGERWYLDSATARADYYVRLFAGMLALGREPSAGSETAVETKV